MFLMLFHSHCVIVQIWTFYNDSGAYATKRESLLSNEIWFDDISFAWKLGRKLRIRQVKFSPEIINVTK